eukprot:PhF_6_TR5541/c0_g2_i1/m.7881/K15296/NAPA, SNAPA, SEC17; alpha-soluble NSF attachment protein
MMESKAREAMEAGDKASKKFFGGESKYEKAREHFMQAGNFYKASQMWLEAANAYTRCMEMSVKLKQEMDVAEDLENAAMCYKKANDPRAKELYEKVIQTYLKNGKGTQASKLAQKIADLCESEGDVPGAIQWYTRAADLMKRENSLRTAQQVLLKVAALHALGGHYDEAIALYEDIGKDYASDRLLKGAARKELFMAALCHLANLKPIQKDEGIDAFQETFQSYEDADSMFTAQTWEHILITKIIQAFKEDSVQQFADAVSEYEDICPMDELKQKLVMRAKDVLKKCTTSEC